MTSRGPAYRGDGTAGSFRLSDGLRPLPPLEDALGSTRVPPELSREHAMRKTVEEKRKLRNRRIGDGDGEEAVQEEKTRAAGKAAADEADDSAATASALLGGRGSRGMRASGTAKDSFASSKSKSVYQALFDTPFDMRSDEDLDNIIRLVAKVKFFTKLPAAVRRDLCRVLSLTYIEQGEKVFEAGDEGSSFYIILQGSVDVVVPDKRAGGKVTFIAATLYSGDSFGELALIESAPRAATIVCTAPCHFLTVHRDDYQRILAAASTRDLDDRIQFLSTVPIFASWSAQELRELGMTMKVRAEPPNSVIVRQGDEADGLYIIRSGEVKIIKQVEFTGGKYFGRAGLRVRNEEKSFKLLEIGRLATTEYFGEIALVKLTKRTASVVTHTQTEFLFLSKNDFARRITGQTLEKVIDGVDTYPSDAEIRHAFQRDATWGDYKKNLVSQILKDKRVRKGNSLNFRSSKD